MVVAPKPVGPRVLYDRDDCLPTLSGIPFLDDEFAHARLLAAVAAVRHVEASRAGLVADRQIETWLRPGQVLRLRRAVPPDASELTAGELEQVVRAVAALGATVPAWRPLLRLPVSFGALTTGAHSASSRAWQQHVLLGPSAFDSFGVLSGQVLHEMCHQWWYCIEELWPLQTDQTEAARVHTLPSGTGPRSSSEVLGAVHVALALIRWYRIIDPGTPRLDELARYAAGCLALLGPTGTDGLTTAGARLAHRLQEAL